MGNVGVVIPTYERPIQTIAAVKSVLSQTLQPVEIIVVDDGSCEATLNTMRTLLKSLGVQLLELPHSGHPGISRKAGVDFLKTEWIAFLDSDDLWKPNKLELQMDHLRQTGRLAICSDAERKSNKHAFFHDYKIGRLITTKTLLKSNLVICSTALVRRDVLLQVGGFATNQEVRGAEDFATWLRVSKFSAFDYLDEPLLIYADESPDSLSSQIARNQIYPRLAGLKDFLRWDRENYNFLARITILIEHLRILIGRQK